LNHFLVDSVVSLAQAAAPSSSNPLTQFVPLVAIFAIFYFLVLRPQSKKAKDHQAMLADLKKGDEVVTQGGVIGKISGITAGEREGKIAEGLEHGNSPFEYPPEFVRGQILVLTTTNGTKLLQMALDKGAKHIITGSFPNLTAVCQYLLTTDRPVILGCAAWKDRVNIEDILFAGAVIAKVKKNFDINCDSSRIAESLYAGAKKDLYGFLKAKNASHYRRLSGYGLDKDIRYCLTTDTAGVLPFFENGKLIVR